MSDFVHCNSCYAIPDQKLIQKFHLTSCAHIFCERCSDKMVQCKVCGSNCRLQEINDKLTPDVKELFMDPSQLVQKQQRRLSEAINFQTSHRSRYLNAMQRKLRNGGKRLQELQRENQELKDELVRVQQRMPRLQTPRMTPNAMQNYRGALNNLTMTGGSSATLPSSCSRLSDGSMYQISIFQNGAGRGRDLVLESPSSAQTAFSVLNISNSSGGSPIIPIAAPRSPYDITWRRDISSMTLNNSFQRNQRGRPTAGDSFAGALKRGF